MRSTVRPFLLSMALTASTALLVSSCAPTDYFDESGSPRPSASAGASDAGGSAPTPSTPVSTTGVPAQNPALAVTAISDTHYRDRVLTSDIYAVEPTDPANTMLVLKLNLANRSEQPQVLRADFTLRVPQQPDISCFSDSRPGTEYPGLQGVTLQPGETREGWLYCEVPSDEDLRGARIAIRDDGAHLMQSVELPVPRR